MHTIYGIILILHLMIRKAYIKFFYLHQELIQRITIRYS